MSHGPEVISLGSVNADLQLRIPRWPDPSETLLADAFSLLGGGKAANVAVLAQRLGAPARLLARVGSDPLADVALLPLAEAGVDLGRVWRVEGERTGVALVIVPPDGRKRILLASGANDSWRDRDREDVTGALASAAEGSVLVIDLEVPRWVVDCAVASARERGLRVVLDPSPADRADDRLLSQVDFAVPNAPEGGQLGGAPVETEADALEAAERLRDSGVDFALVKLAGGGCVIAGPELRAHVRSSDPQVADTTGAGDAFAGALAVALTEGQPAQECARWAVAAADAAVSVWGSQPAYPDRAGFERRLERVEAVALSAD